MSKIHIESEEHWHQLRRNNIGGSDAASLFDQNKFQSHYALWNIKHGIIDAPYSGNTRSEWGKRFEAPIAYGLAEDNGWTIEKAAYYEHPTITGMGCTPDFIIKEDIWTQNRGFSGDGIFEIKNLEHWGYFAEFTRDEANHYIEIQIQHQLACTGLQWGVLGYKLPGQTPDVQFKTRDEAFIQLLEEKVTEFWNSTAAPWPDGSDSSTEIVKALYRRQRGKTFIDLSGNNQLPYLIDELEKLKLLKKPLNADINIIDKQEKAIKNQIMSLSEGAEVIMFQGGEIKINTIAVKPNNGYSYEKITYNLQKEYAS